MCVDKNKSVKWRGWMTQKGGRRLLEPFPGEREGYAAVHPYSVSWVQTESK